MAFLGHDLPPRICPVCDQDLGEYPYYTPGDSGLCLALRKLALLLLPIMTAWVIFAVTRPDATTLLVELAGYAALGPSALVLAISFAIPKNRVVTCLRCSWYQAYSGLGGPLGSVDVRPPQLSEDDRQVDLVGFLTGGIASCSIIGLDCYGKFSVAWDLGTTASSSWTSSTATWAIFP